MADATSDEGAIRALLDKRNDDLRQGDIPAMLVPMAQDATVFDLPPPLAIQGAHVHDAEGIRAWLDTWQGPVSVSLDEMRVRVSGDFALAYGFQHMTGTKKNGERVDLWSRITVALQKVGEGWTIFHEHISVPMMMDGSGKAAVDLKP